MFPYSAPPDEIDELHVDSEPRRYFRARKALALQATDNGHILLSQLGNPMAAPAHRLFKTCTEGVKNVLAESNPLQILYSIVVLVAVKVIDLVLRGRRRADKRTGDQLVYRIGAPSRFVTQDDFLIAPLYARLQGAPARPAAAIGHSAHLSQIANLIRPVRNRPPLFGGKIVEHRKGTPFGVVPSDVQASRGLSSGSF